MFTSFQRLFHQLFWMFVCVSKRHREVKMPLHDDLRRVMDKKHPSEIFWSSQQFWKSWNLTFPLWAWPWKFQLVVILRNFQNPYDYHKFWTEMSTSEVVTSMIHQRSKSRRNRSENANLNFWNFGELSLRLFRRVCDIILSHVIHCSFSSWRNVKYSFN